MAQICIDRFHRIRFSLVRSQFEWRTIIQGAIDGKRITVILFRSQGTIQAGLHRFGGSLGDNIPTEDTARCPIDNG